MRFCQAHWDTLREAIDKRGLTSLIAKDGQAALANTVAELKGDATLANYDPLMAAHWALVNNISNAVGQATLYLMQPDEVPEDVVEGYGAPWDGRTWPRCPLCYINLAHAVSCTDPRCTLDREHGYDVWIAKAADDQAENVAKMKAGA